MKYFGAAYRQWMELAFESGLQHDWNYDEEAGLVMKD